MAAELATLRRDHGRVKAVLLALCNHISNNGGWTMARLDEVLLKRGGGSGAGGGGGSEGERRGAEGGSADPAESGDDEDPQAVAERLVMECAKL